jgi:predicted Zn-dependent peptidase
MAFLYLHYQPSNIVISVAGNFDQHLEKLLNKHFYPDYHLKWKLESSFFKNEYERLFSYQSQWKNVLSLMRDKQNFSSGPTQINHHTYHKQLDHTFVIVAFPGVSVKNPTKYHIQLLAHILGVGMSSRLFDKIRSQEGLVYSIRASHISHNYNGAFTIEYSCQHKPSDQIRILRLIKEELDHLKNEPVQEEEYEKIMSNLISQVKVAQESSYENAFHYGYQLAKEDDIKTHEELVTIYQKITRKDLQINAQLYFDYQNMMICTLSPVKINLETYQKIFLLEFLDTKTNSKPSIKP